MNATKQKNTELLFEKYMASYLFNIQETLSIHAFLMKLNQFEKTGAKGKCFNPWEFEKKTISILVVRVFCAIFAFVFGDRN